MSVETPDFKVIYNSQDITRSLDKYLISLSYLDRTDVESDEIEIVVNDTDKLWSNKWYPEMLASLDVEIGYEGNMVKIGKFEIDKISFNYDSGGRTVSIKALSAVVSQALRTKRTVAYENITLKRLATSVAGRAHLTVSGTIETIQLGRETQQDETDLGFLRRISEEYGYIFSVKEGKIVFTKMDKLQSRKSVLTIAPANGSAIHIDDETGRTYKVAKQTYYDAAKGQVIQYDQSVGNDGDAFAGTGNKSQDAFSTTSYVENKQQAELKAQARRMKIMNGQVVGSVTLNKGVPFLVAGNNIELEKIGKNSGIYFIESSRHVLLKGSGYGTAIEIFKVGSVSETRY